MSSDRDDTVPTIPPYDAVAIGAMRGAIGRYIETTATILPYVTGGIAKGSGGPKLGKLYADAVRMLYPALRSMNGMFLMAVAAAEAGYDPAPVTPQRRAALEDFAGGPTAHPPVIRVDARACLKAQQSFEALSEAMHDVFWTCPGEFWDSPEGRTVSRRFDRTMAEARQAFRELTLDAEVRRQAAPAEPADNA